MVLPYSRTAELSVGPETAQLLLKSLVSQDRHVCTVGDVLPYSRTAELSVGPETAQLLLKSLVSQDRHVCTVGDGLTL